MFVFKNDNKKEIKLEKKVPVKAWHRVNKGESLSIIADKYEVTIENIKKWNLLKTNTIYAGQYLTIYTDSSLVSRNQIIQKMVPQSSATQTIASNNPKNSSKIKSHSNSKSSSPATVSKPQNISNIPQTKKYVVKSGDNLWLIAKKHNISVEKLIKLNPGKTKRLMPGDILILP
jgi:membrane-bound lytic murein transglycosylase D